MGARQRNHKQARNHATRVTEKKTFVRLVTNGKESDLVATGLDVVLVGENLLTTLAAGHTV